MATLKTDVIECWYFLDQLDAQEHKLEKAIGYDKVVDGILKKSKGDTSSKFTYLKSFTEVKRGEK